MSKKSSRDEKRQRRHAGALTVIKGCSGRGTSNGMSVSVKSELSSMSSEPSSMAYRKQILQGSYTKLLTQIQLTTQKGKALTIMLLQLPLHPLTA